MPYARPGSTVTIGYIGTLENGRIFAHTDETGPLTPSGEYHRAS